VHKAMQLLSANPKQKAKIHTSLALSTYVLKIHVNVIFSSTFLSSK